MGLDLTTFRHGLSLPGLVERLQVQFHGVRLHQPDWSEDSHSLAMTLRLGRGSGSSTPPSTRPTTSRPLTKGPNVTTTSYRVEPHSFVFLVAALPRRHCPRPPWAWQRSTSLSRASRRLLGGGAIDQLPDRANESLQS
ncbi:MAG: hypothetical protein WCG47_22100 [Dermatophilaceae bacterium]